MRYTNGDHFKQENGYQIENVWYPRVTRILDIKSKPALEQFFREVGNYAAAEEVKERSAAEGTLVHATAEKIFRGELLDVPQQIGPAIQALQEFLIGRHIQAYPEFIERQVWSRRHRYAGTVDALAAIDGKFGVLDIKTSAAIYPDYNLQTAAYTLALQEFEVKRTLKLPKDIETRWILRIDQFRTCTVCGSTLREKGGRQKIRNKRGAANDASACQEHAWGPMRGDVELREFPHYYSDMKAFIAAKILWEWENGYWLRNIGYDS